MSGKAAYLRAGGQLVRHLVPPQLPLADSYADPAAVAKLIFPRYRPDSPTPLEALERHAQTDSSERPLPSNDVEFLLEFAGKRRCRSLEDSKPEEVVA